MTTFVGIDGIPGGWVAVYLSDNGDQRFAYAKSAARLLADPYDRAMPPRLFEAHPEMIFWRIAGRVLASKNTAKGRAERIEILKEKGIGRVQRWLGQRHGTGIGRDDLIDACACALAARDSTRRVPTNGNLIKRGAQAEIWY